MTHVWYIAGASGTGKSTRAAEIEYHARSAANAPRCLTIATDVIRAQLRSVLDRNEFGDLWGESFNLPVCEGDDLRTAIADDPPVNLSAFIRQCTPILRCVEAGVAYALSEGWNVIVEGIHLVPGLWSLPTRPTPDVPVAVTVEMLTVSDTSEHQARFRSRDVASGGQRPAAHYIANIPRIQVIQNELVSRWADWVHTVAADRDTNYDSSVLRIDLKV